MLKRVAPLILVLLFAGQAMAGGIVCGIDIVSNALDRSSEASCSVKKPGECHKKACCRLGKSPTGATAAMICCEVICGESTGGAQFDFAPLTLAITPSSIVVRIISLDTLSEAEATASSLRSAETGYLRHEPPPLFLQNSAFLI